MADRMRRASPEEAGQLTELALRSKASWGYDPVFMEACRDDLTVTREDIADNPTYVVDGAGAVAGFYLLRPHGRAARLEFLYVAPEAMGKGYGRALFSHAVTQARDAGAVQMTWDADPHAVPFYRKMGARQEGWVPSSAVPGRLLPAMRCDF